MKFISIELENIFAYRSQARVEFAQEDEEKNVFLIWGRNGMGKTSFLNAVKLLFTGTESGQARQVGFPPQILPPQRYVLGDTGNWYGVINRQALKRARADGSSVTARVTAVCESGGRRFKADRSWTTDDGLTFREQLVVIDGEHRLTNDEAEERLESILPKDYVGFFFFDGEEVKAISERVDRQPVDFDRLLRISFVSELSGELETIAKERERKNLNSTLLDKIGAAESTLARAMRSKQAAEHVLTEIDEHLSVDVPELRRLQARRENLSSGASESQRAELEARKKEIEGSLEEARDKVAEDVPFFAPPLANFQLLQQAMQSIEQRLSSVGAPEAIVVRKVTEALPFWLEELASDDLSNDSRARLSSGLAEKVEELVRNPTPEGLFGGLELARAERLRRMMVRLIESGPDRQALQLARLNEVTRLKFDLSQVSDALLRIEVGSQANLDEFRRVTATIVELESRIAEVYERKGHQQTRLEDASQEIARSRKTLDQLGASQAQATKNSEEARAIRKIAKTLNDLREAMRVETREQIQERINQRLLELIYEHPLIARVELDDNYVMHFIDGVGDRIGRSSLSSGLRQLAATALLWAMKDVAGHDVPVIIDTPLGRIDRENQINLLANYYPKISHQVIILPTNSELEGGKLARLRPYIAREFTIRNDRGDMGGIEVGGLVVEEQW
ncbi:MULTISPECIES: DNA sulfur modification protein DndD [unclassified Ensifer]|uniref:DNA sulfur modification protein DndD n=1 Tax=unclassified Ensifer TaxID=2633371 RepID=UPI000813D4C7|nr:MULTISPECIES: DNA sulfur modification protein DndD [unclassified Ensifer]OCP19774.1 DNA sulfur modification protein DndD [Ensifer sp. LC54]OCP25955.1 DNA sulfur modification protein DndD [Ensifer sp. LC384]